MWKYLPTVSAASPTDGTEIGAVPLFCLHHSAHLHYRMWPISPANSPGNLHKNVCNTALFVGWYSCV